MGDRFVDVSYRGLEIGRQLKLRDVTTEGAYLESTTPMPVGSPIEVIIDDGTRLAAMVASVHEQVAGGTGSDSPGMRIRPVASGVAARRWWENQPEPPPRAAPATRDVADVPPPTIIEVAPPAVAANAATVDEPAAPINGAVATHDSGEPTIDSMSSSDSIPVVSVADISSSGELDAVDVDDDDASESSASRPIATGGTNGHGDRTGPRKKSKTGKRRKRNTR